MKFQKQLLSIVASLFLFNSVQAQNDEKAEQLILTPGPISGNYQKNDLNETYNENSIEIQCTGATCASNSDNVLLEEGKVTLTKAGTYVFDGELDGQLDVTANKDDLIHLVLRNATITSGMGPAIYAKKCKKLIITLEGQNTISDSENYPEIVDLEDDEKKEIEEEIKETGETVETEKKKNVNACIYVKNSLTINGKGTLNVNGNYFEGIRTKKSMKLISGVINIKAINNAIKAKESLSIMDAELNLDAGNDGIKVTMDTDPNQGFVVIEGGNLVINAGKDAVHAETHLTVSDGKITVTQCEEGLEGQMVDIIGGDILIYTSNDGINASLIGANNQVTLGNFGNFNFNFTRSSRTNRTNAGNFDFGSFGRNSSRGHSRTTTIEQIDLEEETETAIEDEVQFEEPTEEPVEEPTEEPTEEPEERGSSRSGREGNRGGFGGWGNFGNWGGFGGNGGTDFTKNYANEDQVYIRITGGRVEVRADGPDLDGIDSNGSLYFGGTAEIYVDSVVGGCFGHAASIDSDGSKTLDAGITSPITGTGKFGFGGMGGFGGSSYDEPQSKHCLQPYVYAKVDIQEEGTLITILDSDNKVVVLRKPIAPFGIIFYTSPNIVEGKNYTVIAGYEAVTVTAQIDLPEVIPDKTAKETDEVTAQIAVPEIIPEEPVEEIPTEIVEEENVIDYF